VSAAAAIVFLFTFTSFGVIRVLGAPGTRTIEVEVWRRATQLGDIGGAAVLTMLQLAVLGVVVAWSAVVQRRQSRAIDLRPATARRRPASGAERRIVRITAGLTTAAVLAPLLALVVRSFSTPTGWSAAGWTNLGRTEIRPGLRVGIDPVDALWNSVRIAAWATLLAVVVGRDVHGVRHALGHREVLLEPGYRSPVVDGGQVHDQVDRAASAHTAPPVDELGARDRKRPLFGVPLRAVALVARRTADDEHAFQRQLANRGGPLAEVTLPVHWRRSRQSLPSLPRSVSQFFILMT